MVPIETVTHIIIYFRLFEVSAATRVTVDPIKGNSCNAFIALHASSITTGELKEVHGCDPRKLVYQLSASYK